jgi:malonyl-CoA O-methyltransferase
MPEDSVGTGAETSAAPAIDPRALRRVLDRLARADGPPWLHQEVARRMAARLPVIRQPPERWLDWWSFTGAGAEAVQAVWPQAQRLLVEPTPALQARSRAALAAPWWSWRARRASAQPVWLSSEVPPGAAQMLWANLVLHTAADPEASLAVWHRALAADGFLMFSAFGPDTLRELREVYADAGWPAPHPPFVDMHDLGDMLVHGGFADPVMDQETITLTWSTPEALLAELRALGGHLGLHRHAGLRTPRWHARLRHALAARTDAQGRIAMRFEVVYGHAYKGVPRPAPGAPVVVSLDALRSRRSTRKS